MDPSWTLGRGTGPQPSLFGPQQTDPTDNCDYKMKDPSIIALLEFLKAQNYLNYTIMDHFLMHFIFMIELNTFRAEKLKIRNNGLTYLTVSVTAGSGSLSPSF